MDLDAWRTEGLRQIQSSLQDDTYWFTRLRESCSAIHLGVFAEPFLSRVLDGTKSVESRFSTRRCAPFGRVEAGDILLLKEASGPVTGICEVASTWFFNLRSTPIERIRERFGAAICADDAFWSSRQSAAFATVLLVRAVRAVAPVACPKRDRRGWVVFPSTRASQLELPMRL